MKITREIIINGMSNNTEYELTGVELERCFNEYQSTHDRNEVVHQLKDLEYEDLENIPEDIIADLASQFREKMDNLMDDVALDVIRNNEEVLEQYKQKWKVFTKTIHVEAEKSYAIKARSESEAETIWEQWSEQHGDRITEDMYEEVQYNGDWDWDYDMDEDEYGDPDDADISGDDV